MQHEHRPVLLKEVIEGLAIKANGIYIDATFGRGGHSLEILRQLGPKGRLIAIDKDPEAIKFAQGGSFLDKRFVIEHASFANLEEIVGKYRLEGKVDGILMDLGVSSPQLDDPKRGFSFLREGPLDMRMNTGQEMTAADWLNSAALEEISLVLKQYGEERFAKRIATAIVDGREKKPFTTTIELAECITKAVPFIEKHKHPATRSFQAIRIFINNEIKDLHLALEQCLNALAIGGRLCIISFHSLEDRIVKQFIRSKTSDERFPPNLPIPEKYLHKKIKKIGKLIRASEDEIEMNRRARSARLRIAEKIA